VHPRNSVCKLILRTSSNVINDDSTTAAVPLIRKYRVKCASNATERSRSWTAHTPKCIRMYIYTHTSDARRTRIYIVKHCTKRELEKSKGGRGGEGKDVCVHARVVRERKENTPTRDRVTQDK